jgi:hypothetical protein
MNQQLYLTVPLLRFFEASSTLQPARQVNCVVRRQGALTADCKNLSRTEQLLSMAAFVKGYSQNTDIARANTNRALNQVLHSLGLDEAQIRHGWEQPGAHPTHNRVYEALI